MTIVEEFKEAMKALWALLDAVVAIALYLFQWFAIPIVLILLNL